MVQMMDELGSIMPLTKDGVYRLFGYDLDSLRDVDDAINGDRTHVIESYVFQRDQPVELPLVLASAEAFEKNAMLDKLVLRWQRNIPIRSLDRSGWRHVGAFYVRVGREDSLGSSLPPGSTALVEPTTEQERLRPNPRAIYLLQFANGYRFSRCVATHGRLQLLGDNHPYRGPEIFSYPSGVRIAGRVRSYAVALPTQKTDSPRGLWTYQGTADLILPWEHATRWSLLSTKHRRFVRDRKTEKRIQEALAQQLRGSLSDRSRRRYRRPTDSQPHVDGLIQLSLESLARFSDLLRLGASGLRDAGRLSLEQLLAASTAAEMPASRTRAQMPEPAEVWHERQREMLEYGSLFALKFPRPSELQKDVMRVSHLHAADTLPNPIRPGSWLALEPTPTNVIQLLDSKYRASAEQTYVLEQSKGLICGNLQNRNDSLWLRQGSHREAHEVQIEPNKFGALRRVCGAVIPA